MKDISKIISNLFLGVSFLFLFYVIYRSEIHHSGLESRFYFKYYVIAFLFITISFKPDVKADALFLKPDLNLSKIPIKF